MPKSRMGFWQKRFSDNIKRDKYVQQILESKGIKCLLIWKCTIKEMKKDDNYKEEIIKRIELFLNTEELFAEY